VLENQEEFFRLSREQQIARLLLSCPLDYECECCKNCQWKQVQLLKLGDKISWLEEQDKETLNSMLEFCITSIGAKHGKDNTDRQNQ
jgi:hypothetical protein